MKRLLMLIAIVSMLPGCSYIKLWEFSKADNSGVRSNKVNIAFSSDVGKWKGNGTEYMDAYLTKEEEIRNDIVKACAPEVEEKFVAAAVPAVAALAKMIFDLYVDERIHQIEELKKRAERSYSGRKIISANSLLEYKYAAIYRYKDEDSKPGLIAILELVKNGDKAFSVKPCYIKMNNSMAITEKAKGADKESMIDITFGFSVKTLGMQESKIPGVFSVGEGVVSIPNVPIDAKSKAINCKEKKCGMSDIIPYVGDQSSVASVTISATETGHVGIDFDRSATELKTIKEAMGPAVSEAIKERLTDKDK